MSVSRKRVRVLAGACALLLVGGLLAGCKKSTAETAATVNGQAVTEKALNAEVAKLKLQSPQLFAKGSGMSEGTIRSALLSELVSQELLSQEAKRRGVSASDAEVEKNITSLKAGYSSTKQFEQALSSAGYTMTTLKESVRWQLLETKLLAKLVPASAITDKQARDYYNKHASAYKVKAAKRCSHILFATKDKATAEKVLKQLQSGADFAAMAKKYSTDTASAVKGGDLGWPTQAYVTEFQNAVDKLKKGEMSGLVKSAYGYHIIKCTDTRKAGTQTYEQAKDQVEQTLLSQKRNAAYQTLLNSLEKKAKIVIVDAKAKSASKSSTGSTTGATTGSTTGSTSSSTGK